MPRRNTPHAVEGLDDLSHLNELVYDKRLGQRALAKKNRRNRHYEKLFIRHALARQAEPQPDPQTDPNAAEVQRADSSEAAPASTQPERSTMEDPRCCGTGTCIINAEGVCWCGQKWDGTKMCFPERNTSPNKAEPTASPAKPDAAED